MLIRGERAARRQWNELQALRQYIYADGSDSIIQSSKVQKPSYTDAYPIGHIEIEGITGEEKEWIRKRLFYRNSRVFARRR